MRIRTWDSEIFLTLGIRGPGWKNLDPGSGINIPDPQTLTYNIVILCILAGCGEHLTRTFLARECGQGLATLTTFLFRPKVVESI
jgi:hypothetical protein